MWMVQKRMSHSFNSFLLFLFFKCSCRCLRFLSCPSLHFFHSRNLILSFSFHWPYPTIPPPLICGVEDLFLLFREWMAEWVRDGMRETGMQQGNAYKRWSPEERNTRSSNNNEGRRVLTPACFDYNFPIAAVDKKVCSYSSSGHEMLPSITSVFYASWSNDQCPGMEQNANKTMRMRNGQNACKCSIM